jgi:phosphopantothenoylcysteine decarboxylase/phosphopantothenate--cysteine ligase
MNDLEVTRTTDCLEGVRIALCVGGGVAAIESPRVVRELRRMGARVKVFATENALRFVGRDALEWASTLPVISSSTGLAEHIASSEDMVVVLPATADLIAKSALGICPDACTTFIQSALGLKLPVFFCPTMHDSLRDSPAFVKNLELLSSYPAVELLQPRIEEGKWKSPSPEGLALELAHRYNRIRRMRDGRAQAKALVTLGGTLVPIDAARAICNFSTGVLGSMVVKRLLEQGVEVVALCGSMQVSLPECTGLKTFSTPFFDQLSAWLSDETKTKDFGALFHLAAISDYAPETPSTEKIPSDALELELNLRKLPKLIELPSLSKIPFRFACKLTSGNSTQEMEKAISLLEKMNLNGIYWNWSETAFGSHRNHAGFLIDKSRRQTEIDSKSAAALAITKFYMEQCG